MINLMRIVIVCFLIVFSLELNGENKNTFVDFFSKEAREWADSIYQTLDLEHKLAQILIVESDLSSLESFSVKLPPPGFIRAKAENVFHLTKDEYYPLNTFFVADIKDGFSLKNNELKFPEEHSLLMLDPADQAVLKNIFLHQLFKSKNHLFSTSNRQSKSWVGGEIVETNYLSSQDVMWIPASVDSGNSRRAVGVKIYKAPQQIVGLLPSRLPQISQSSSLIKEKTNDLFASDRYRPVTEVSVEQVLENKMLLSTSNYDYDFKRLLTAFQGRWLKEDLLESVCKIALAIKYEALYDSFCGALDFPPSKEDLTLRRIYENSISIMQNKTNFPFPLSDMDIKIGFFDNTENSASHFRTMAANYVYTPTCTNEGDYNVIFCLLDDRKDTSNEVDNLIKNLKRQHKNAALVFVWAGNVNYLPFSGSIYQPDALIMSPINHPYIWSSMAQVAFGGIGTKRKEHLSDLEDKIKLKQIDQQQGRLKYGIPEEVGMSGEELKDVDKLIENSIKNKATPGAQILVARNGVIVWNKSYGYHDYQKTKNVDNTDLYDLASVTKVVATLPVLMKLYDDQRWRLGDALGSFLPEADTTDKKDITMRQLLLHESGFPASIAYYLETIDYDLLDDPLFNRRRSPLYSIRVENKLYANKNASLRYDLFRKIRDLKFSVPVAEGLYLNENFIDSLYQKIFTSQLRINSYRYSDVNFQLLQKITENLTGEKLDLLCDNLFYKTIGASSLCFNPWKIYSLNRIVPTENDLFFRKQLIHGYVHDQAAALFGGVAGHAGLFGNAGDLAKILQMYLNNGVYGYRRYLKSETVEFFTRQQHSENRRGLGFDKPELDKDKVSPAGEYASPLSYGHSGFTGTIAWVDPKYNLIFIFLSNRIHPQQYNSRLIEENIRTELQNIVYRSIKD